MDTSPLQVTSCATASELVAGGVAESAADAVDALAHRGDGETEVVGDLLVGLFTEGGAGQQRDLVAVEDAGVEGPGEQSC